MDPAGRRVTPWRSRARRRLVFALLAVATLTAATACGGVGTGGTGDAGYDLGSGFVVQPGPASAWLEAHPDDPRAGVVRDRIANQPTALWLTGPDSYANLTDAVARARDADGTALFTVYDVPGRDDGVSAVSKTSLQQYEDFVDRVASTIGSTRAVIVLEPDALWFVDRQTPPGTDAYAERMAALNHAVSAFAALGPTTRVYLEAGTASGSVTPERMAQLLHDAGIEQAAGYAVNVSSFAPTDRITAYAQAIRTALTGSFGLADPRYVVDTGRNGNPDWDNTWCNPDGRELGAVPAVVGASDGLDADLWVKAPGTSDGDCGNGDGSVGGQFLPDVAYDQAT